MERKLMKISDAVAWLKKEKGISYSRMAIYQMIYAGKLPYTQAQFKGAGSVRSGGRIMIAQEDLEKMFVSHPAEAK